MFIKIILPIFIFFTTTNCEKNLIFKKVSVGNSKEYNLLFKVSLNTKKDYKLISFERVKSQKLYFKFKNKILNAVDLFKQNYKIKFIVSSISVIENLNEKYYTIELFIGNGEPEIKYIYTANGNLLIHSESIKGQTKYRFIEKNTPKNFLLKSKILESKDVTFLYAD